MRIDGFEFLARAYAYEGRPYVWGRKGPDLFDCSGLVTHVVRECGGPDWRENYSAAKLYDRGVLEPFLPELETGFPKGIPRSVALALQIPAGVLAFYGPPGSIAHVMVCTGDGRVFGSSGGDRTTLAPTPGACVQFRPSVVYRPGLRGFRLLPELVQ